MKNRALRADALLLLTATIWGFAFVAQRVGMNHVGPFTFNGIRFALGSLSLIPLLVIHRRQEAMYGDRLPARNKRMVSTAGLLAGVALFLGASLQQIGLVYTTAGNAGFITGLYVVLVPILGLVWKQVPDAGTWIGAACAVVGLYLLSVTGGFSISQGDLYVLAGALFWALHVHIIGWFCAKVGSILLAFMQFVVCSVLSLGTAFLLEPWSLNSLRDAWLPIFYGGCLSVGVAYTLQVVAQKDARPAHAAILLSLESVFAALGGWLLLNEILSGRGILGCAFMLLGMLLSQLGFRRPASRSAADVPTA